MIDYGFYNMDCMEGMRQFPDKYFDLAIVDPPYGINMGHTCGVGGGGTTDTSKAINVYGGAASNKAKQNFIIRSMIARHRTVNTLKNYSEYLKSKLCGVETSFSIISIELHA